MYENFSFQGNFFPEESSFHGSLPSSECAWVYGVAVFQNANKNGIYKIAWMILTSCTRKDRSNFWIMLSVA